MRHCLRRPRFSPETTPSAQLSEPAKWLHSRDGGNDFLKDLESDPVGGEYAKDRVVLVSEGDRFDNVLAGKGRDLYQVSLLHRRHRKPSTDPELGIGRLWEYK